MVEAQHLSAAQASLSRRRHPVWVTLFEPLFLHLYLHEAVLGLLDRDHHPVGHYETFLEGATFHPGGGYLIFLVEASTVLVCCGFVWQPGHGCHLCRPCCGFVYDFAIYGGSGCACFEASFWPQGLNSESPFF